MHYGDNTIYNKAQAEQLTSVYTCIDKISTLQLTLKAYMYCWSKRECKSSSNAYCRFCQAQQQ